jgi:carboxyl-terminal processing protease
MRAAAASFLLHCAIAAPAVAQSPAPATQAASEAAGARADALGLEALINDVYAYPERLPGGRFTLTPRLRAEAETVADRRSLLRFAERALMLLADHHAITGASFSSSYAVVPTYADLWIEPRGARYLIEAVRSGSPAEAAGIRAGDALVEVGGVPTAQAVRAFWEDLGAEPLGERAGFAARMLAAGRRDSPRRLTVEGPGGRRTLDLPSLYAVQRPNRPPVETSREAGALVIRINDALGDSATIAAFDAAMRQASPRQPIVVDLSETPSGGNTTVARAILGWFVEAPRFYQMHSLPGEQRRTGIARQWVEQVLPRPGLRHRGPVEVRVGRWTGSMGEGLAIGFHAIGASVTGSRMAGLLGAIYDHRLSHSGLVVKIPTERLMTVTGQPRESFVPRPLRRHR